MAEMLSGACQECKILGCQRGAAQNLISELRAERSRLLAVVGWVESWVSNPVGSYSVSALDGLFGMTRDKIAALEQTVRKP